MDSTDMSPERLESVRKGLLKAVLEIKAWKRGLVRSKAEFFQGDAWQLLLADPGMALRAVIFLRAALRSRYDTDTRIAIGIGGVDHVSSRRVSLSSGEAFRRSGRALDTMRPLNQLSIDAGSGNPFSPLLPAVGILCDALVCQWTGRQAELVRLASDPSAPTQEDIAARLGITRQSVSRNLGGAGWTALRTAIDRFEEIEWRDVETDSTSR